MSWEHTEIIGQIKNNIRMVVASTIMWHYESSNLKDYGAQSSQCWCCKYFYHWDVMKDRGLIFLIPLNSFIKDGYAFNFSFVQI